MTLNYLQIKNSGLLVILCDFRLQCTFEEWIFVEITGVRRRQPACGIKL